LRSVLVSVITRFPFARLMWKVRSFIVTTLSRILDQPRHAAHRRRHPWPRAKNPPRAAAGLARRVELARASAAVRDPVERPPAPGPAARPAPVPVAMQPFVHVYSNICHSRSPAASCTVQM
jgi:hypothetical protein